MGKSKKAGEYTYTGENRVPISTKKAKISPRVKTIQKGAFSFCQFVKKISLPPSIKTIQSRSFDYCRSLRKVQIPSSVKYIGHRAFYRCETLKSVRISSSVVEIGAHAFADCTALETVVIETNSSSLGSLPYGVFSGCANLKSVLFVESESSSSCALSTIEEKAFFGCECLTAVSIPNSVTSIGKDAFFNCKSLASVVIPSSVTSFGDHAFFGCAWNDSLGMGKGIINEDATPRHIDSEVTAAANSTPLKSAFPKSEIWSGRLNGDNEEYKVNTQNSNDRNNIDNRSMITQLRSEENDEEKEQNDGHNSEHKDDYVENDENQHKMEASPTDVTNQSQNDYQNLPSTSIRTDIDHGINYLTKPTVSETDSECDNEEQKILVDESSHSCTSANSSSSREYEKYSSSVRNDSSRWNGSFIGAGREPNRMHA